MTGSLGPLELHEGSHASSRIWRGNLGLLSGHCRRKWPHFTLMGAYPGFSRVVVGGLGFLSRYHGELREPLMLPQGSQVSIRVLRWSAGLLWSHDRGMRSQFAWKSESQGVSRGAAGSLGSLELPRGPEGASHLVSEKLELFWSCEGPLGIPLELVQGLGPHVVVRRETQGSSPVLTSMLGFLWRFHLGVRCHLVLRHGTALPSRGVNGVSDLLSS